MIGDITRGEELSANFSSFGNFRPIQFHSGQSNSKWSLPEYTDDAPKRVDLSETNFATAHTRRFQ